MMDVCFCDIDGVLNFSSYGEDIYYDKFHDKEIALDQECVDNFLKLLEMFPDLKIVWSTDWRFDDNVYWNTWRNPRKYLEETYPILKSRVIGKTPKRMSSSHYHEVKWWLDQNASNNELDGYVVIDDLKFPEPWFGIEKHTVWSNPCKGFTKDNLQQAIEILKHGGGYVNRKT
jgi:hypothetical protein